MAHSNLETATPQVGKVARLAAGRDPRQLERMMRSRQDEVKEPPPGEWAVFYERPFPKRLDRAFHIGAGVAGIAGAVALVAWVGAATGPPADVQKVAILAGLALGAAGMSYGFVRGLGLVVTSLYGFTRRKQYVLDWYEPLDKR